jgi:hypothetical protein
MRCDREQHDYGSHAAGMASCTTFR